MNVTVSLNQSTDLMGIANKLAAYASSFESKAQEVCTRLCEIGQDVLNATYAVAAYAGTNDISVSMESTDKGATLTATGTVLGFIEFGTGVLHPLGAYAGQVGAPAHGTYGKGMGKQGIWVYVGDPGNTGIPIANTPRGTVVMTDGNPPADAFPKAVQAMRENFDQIVQEVFRFD